MNSMMSHNAFDGGIFRVVFFLDRLNVHTFNCHHRKARACSLSVQQTEGLRVGFKEWADGWPVCEVWVDRWAEGEVKPKVL